MNKTIYKPKWLNLIYSASFICALLLTNTGCKKTYERPSQQGTISKQDILRSEKGRDLKEANEFQQVNLVANNAEYNALHIDPTLLNAWGLVFTPNGIAWVNSQSGHVSEIYNSEGVTLRPPVAIPSPTGPTGGSPTGIVFNASNTIFKLSNGSAARFIFVGDDGIISGWNPAAGNMALLVHNNSATSAYTGLTLDVNNGDTLLYAANFRTKKIDVFNGTFSPVMLPFHDPFLPSGYAPFNIQNIGGLLYVTYAKIGPDGTDQAGPGQGFVNIFRANGSFLGRFASHGHLNSPWGVAMAPAGFINMKEDEDHDGDHDGDDDRDDHRNREKDKAISHNVILIGNLGDGRINAYSERGKFLGALQSNGKPIVIEGLWALVFPPTTATTVDPNRLYFTAGPSDETDGLFGYIIPSL